MKTHKLMMIPGPTPVARSIQEQLGRETIAFGDPVFVQDFKDILKDLRELWRTDGEVFVVAGSGTLAMEMAVANTTKRGEKALVVSHGYFGDRFRDICTRKGLEVDVLSSEWGKTVPLDEVRKALSSKTYAIMTVTHVDTSTGACADADGFGKMMKDFPETIFVLDGVCATAGVREQVDDMGVDILFTGSQKAFGVPPGLMMLWAGKKALQKRSTLGTIPEYYCDFDTWLPIMHDPSKYFATPAVNMMWALKEAIAIIKHEGLEARYSRHERFAAAIWAGLEALGLRILAAPGSRAVTVSGVLYKEGTDDAAFRKTLAEEGVQVAAGLGPYAGKLFRLGHMGNIDAHILVDVIAAIERTLIRLGQGITPGAGLAALQEKLTGK